MKHKSQIIISKSPVSQRKDIVNFTKQANAYKRLEIQGNVLLKVKRFEMDFISNKFFSTYFNGLTTNFEINITYLPIILESLQKVPPDTEKQWRSNLNTSIKNVTFTETK